MRTPLLILILSVFTHLLFAQTFNIPKNVKFNSEEDYIKAEKEVLAAIDWLQETSVADQLNKRKAVNTYIMQWLTGSPTVSVEIGTEVMQFEDCADCLMAFLGGWTKYSLENNYSKDKSACKLAGVNQVIDLYTKNRKELGKIKGIEKWIKLKEKGKLEKQLNSND